VMNYVPRGYLTTTDAVARVFQARHPDLAASASARQAEMQRLDNVAPQVETIPSVQHGISAIASAHAPFIYFEDAPAFGHRNGVIRITLTAGRDIPLPPAVEAGHDWVVVCHLRMSVFAALSLKSAIDRALLLGAPVASGSSDASGAASKPN
jgi:hypothetical protein